MLIVMFRELVNLVKLGCLIIFGNLGRQFLYCHSVILLAFFHISKRECVFPIMIWPAFRMKNRQPKFAVT